MGPLGEGGSHVQKKRGKGKETRKVSAICCSTEKQNFPHGINEGGSGTGIVHHGGTKKKSAEEGGGKKQNREETMAEKKRCFNWGVVNGDSGKKYLQKKRLT